MVTLSLAILQDKVGKCQIASLSKVGHNAAKSKIVSFGPVGFRVIRTWCKSLGTIKLFPSVVDF
jgi:hypothetical protein